MTSKTLTRLKRLSAQKLLRQETMGADVLADAIGEFEWLAESNKVLRNQLAGLGYTDGGGMAMKPPLGRNPFSPKGGW